MNSDTFAFEIICRSLKKVKVFWVPRSLNPALLGSERKISASAEL